MDNKTFDLIEVKAADNSGTFSAYASVFDNVDHVGDRMLRGAFSKTLGEWRKTGDPIPVILSHKHDDPMAMIGEADPRAVYEDNRGLMVQGKLDLENPVAKQVHKLMKRRLLKGWSFGYVVPPGGQKQANGANEISTVDLIEVGPTLKGANADALLQNVKSATALLEGKAVGHEPVGPKPLWGHQGLQLPAYIQHIANDLIHERGMTESRAIATAISRCKAWCGGADNVTAETKAKACEAVAQWEALKARVGKMREDLDVKLELDRYDDLAVDLSKAGPVQVTERLPSPPEKRTEPLPDDLRADRYEVDEVALKAAELGPSPATPAPPVPAAELQPDPKPLPEGVVEDLYSDIEAELKAAEIDPGPAAPPQVKVSEAELQPDPKPLPEGVTESLYDDIETELKTAAVDPGPEPKMETKATPPSPDPAPLPDDVTADRYLLDEEALRVAAADPGPPETKDAPKPKTKSEPCEPCEEAEKSVELRLDRFDHLEEEILLQGSGIAPEADAKAFDPNQRRNPHSGEWIREGLAAVAHRITGKPTVAAVGRDESNSDALARAQDELDSAGPPTQDSLHRDNIIPADHVITGLHPTKHVLDLNWEYQVTHHQKSDPSHSVRTSVHWDGQGWAEGKLPHNLLKAIAGRARGNTTEAQRQRIMDRAAAALQAGNKPRTPADRQRIMSQVRRRLEHGYQPAKGEASSAIDDFVDEALVGFPTEAGDRALIQKAADELPASKSMESNAYDELEFSLASEGVATEGLPTQKVGDVMTEAELLGVRDSIIKMVWSTNYVNDLPDSAFLYIADGGSKDADGKTTPRSLRYFPYKDSNGKIDLPHLRNAIARIPQASGMNADQRNKLQDRARRVLDNAQSEGKRTEVVPASMAATDASLHEQLSALESEFALDGVELPSPPPRVKSEPAPQPSTDELEDRLHNTMLTILSGEEQR